MNMQARLQAAIDAANKQTDEHIEKRIAEMLPELERDDSSSVASCPQLPGDTNDTDVKPVRKLVKIKELSDKAMLCSLRISTFSPYKRDEEATADYGAGSVNKHLFAGRDNRVKKLNALYSQLSRYLRDETVPYRQKGVYMLNAKNYFNVTSGIRAKNIEISKALDDLELHWSTAVQTDFNRIYAINPALANYDDYPTDIRSKYGHELDFMPVPKADDFDPMWGMSEEDRSSVQRQLDEADMQAATHVIKQLMVPMQAAVDHLAKPIEDVKGVNSSLVDNMIDVADRMNRVNLSDDPEVQKQIDDLTALASGINTNGLKVKFRKGVIVKHDKHARSSAKTDIETLMSQMKGLV